MSKSSIIGSDCRRYHQLAGKNDKLVTKLSENNFQLVFNRCVSCIHQTTWKHLGIIGVKDNRSNFENSCSCLWLWLLTSFVSKRLRYCCDVLKFLWQSLSVFKNWAHQLSWMGVGEWGWGGVGWWWKGLGWRNAAQGGWSYMIFELSDRCELLADGSATVLLGRLSWLGSIRHICRALSSAGWVGRFCRRASGGLGSIHSTHLFWRINRICINLNT